MRRIVYTQRVEIINAYKERRDCADQKIPEFLFRCGYLPIPLPNIGSLTESFVTDLAPNGIVLTGGNSLVKYGGDAPEKDEIDRMLIQFGIDKKIPVLGICRGMQSILDYFEQPVIDVEKHVACHHRIIAENHNRIVNSFHKQGIKELSAPLQIWARSEDGVVEGCNHEFHKIRGIMWHPERNRPFDILDITMFQVFFDI